MLSSHKNCMVLASILPLLEIINAAVVVHSHSNHLNKEREQDGAYSPRNHWHNPDSEKHDVGFDHESILGSAKEAEEFDNLEPEQAKARLAILLKKMDLNRDQEIDRHELKAWILRSFRMLTEEEAQEHLEDVDENGDGAVSWEEYVTRSYGTDDSKELTQMAAENEKLLKDDKMMWDKADKNGDDILEGDEWVAFTHPEENPEMLPLILQQTLRDKDINKDGYIEFQEFVGEQGKNLDKEKLIEEKHRFDEEYDLDGDGKLNRNEIFSWIVPSNDDMAEEEVVHLFEESDDDQDDVLSFQEILDHYDTFVGSEATDYGEQLQNIHHFQDEL